MRNFAKLFVVALVITIVASMFVLSTSAAAVTDPNELKPGSETVYFIMDPDENGELPGDGSGTSPENPYKPIDHEGFDPEADPGNLKQYLQTAFYQVTELMRSTGGTVVIMGPVLLGRNQTWGTTAMTTADVHTARFTTNTIKFTSVYNGVDYRETNGAKLTIESPAEVAVFGQTIWENLDIETNGTERVIAFNHFATLIGEGVKCYPQEEGYATVASHYIGLAGGGRFEGGVDKTMNMVVKSGTYNVITAGIWGVTNQRGRGWTYNSDGVTSAKLTLEGTTTVLGQIYGTTRKQSEFSGMTEITINGGSYPCEIYAVGPTGMMSRDGSASIKINGGDFTQSWDLRALPEGYINNAPAAAILDFSGFKGDTKSLAAAYNLAATAGDFTMTKLPEGVSEDELKNMVAQTTAPVTDAPATNDGSAMLGTAAPDQNNDKKPGAAVDVDEGDGMNLGLIIGIAAAAVVVIAAVVVVIIVSKKKKAGKTEAKTEEADK